MAEQMLSRDALDAMLGSEQLRHWLARQRWYASKSLGVTALGLLDHVSLDDAHGLQVVLVQAHLATGVREIYQLLVSGAAPAGAAPGEPASDQPAPDQPAPAAGPDGPPPPQSAHSAGFEAYDGMRDPRLPLRLLECMLDDSRIATDAGCFTFHHVKGAQRPSAHARTRPIGSEQTNSTVVVDERTALKLVRRVESGINPELEMLRFLSAAGFEQIPRLEGWYEYEGESFASTLGIAMGLIVDGRDGWELALELITSAPEQLLELLGELGGVTARLHNALASDSEDPAFCPEEPINESLSLLMAAIDEEIERIFTDLPETDALAPIYGRGADVRARLAARSQLGAGGKNIRIHGDYHLGQALHTDSGWVIIDFEGEPARGLPERRQKRSPLRDVAGALRSIAYAVAALELLRSERPPEGFEQRARSAFLDAYLEQIDLALLPSGEAAIESLLSIFELQKSVYELHYELNHRPDWVSIPVAGIVALLEERR